LARPWRHVDFIHPEEWLDVMNDIIGGLKEKNEFPEWYEGLHKALFRANEFLGTSRRTGGSPLYSTLV
jgi:hypothetical protein